ncbi:MAG TPA: hypothetical protein VF230_04795, partial [Acidimicrobiales bacterium]
MPQRTTRRKPAAKSAATKRADASRTTTPASATTRTRPNPAEQPASNGTGQPRLGKGGLEALVLDHMKKHPKVEFTSTELSNKLHRSNGAISNALEKHAALGTVVRTSDSPRRYRWRGNQPTRASQ